MRIASHKNTFRSPLKTKVYSKISKFLKTAGATQGFQKSNTKLPESEIR